MTKELIVAAVLGTALTAGWFIPVGIEAAYTGDRVYQSEMISKNDVDIHSFSLLGRKKEIEVFDMRPASLNGEDLEFDISASNMTTTLDVNVIPVDKCIWEYNGTVYEGDRFNRDKLSGYVAYEDGRREALKDFTLKYAPLVFGGGSNEISVETPFGTDTISVEAVRVTGIRMDGKKTIYEGKHKGKDFLFTLQYSDGATRSIPSSDVYLPKFKLVSGKNHVTVSYNDRPYIVTVEAKSRRQ